MKSTTKQPAQSASELVQGPSHLPEPGIDVYIQRSGSPQMELARLERARNYFVLAKFPMRGKAAGRTGVAVDAVVRWDYAVPAGDLLS
jgi:hypothetical protein